MKKLSTNKEKIREKYLEDIDLIVHIARKNNIFDPQIIETSYEHTRVFHVLAAVQFMAAVQGKSIKETIPAIKQIKEMFEAMERITASARGF